MVGSVERTKRRETGATETATWVRVYWLEPVPPGTAVAKLAWMVAAPEVDGSRCAQCSSMVGSAAAMAAGAVLNLEHTWRSVVTAAQSAAAFASARLNELYCAVHTLASVDRVPP
jgi:hypothetical protein